MGNRYVYVDGRGQVCSRDHPEAKKIADSEIEYARWLYLLQMQRLGLISGLLRQQVVFPLHAVNSAGVRTQISHYKPDFVYVENGQRVIEDVKGKLTAAYKLARKWMLHEYGITIREIRKGDW